MLDIETEVRKSKIDGLGVFALQDFNPAEVVLAWDTSNTLSDEQYERVPFDQKQYVVRYKDEWLYLFGTERYLNHSCDPNTAPLRGNSVSVREIHPGDEITTDYSPVLPEGWRMACRCGATACKGYIEGTST